MNEQYREGVSYTRELTKCLLLVWFKVLFSVLALKETTSVSWWRCRMFLWHISTH